jgi:hypothetical protein
VEKGDLEVVGVAKLKWGAAAAATASMPLFIYLCVPTYQSYHIWVSFHFIFAVTIHTLGLVLNKINFIFCEWVCKRRRKILIDRSENNILYCVCVCVFVWDAGGGRQREGKIR